MKNNNYITYWDVAKDILIYGVMGWFIIGIVLPFLIIARKEVSKLFAPEEDFNI